MSFKIELSHFVPSNLTYQRNGFGFTVMNKVFEAIFRL